MDADGAGCSSMNKSVVLSINPEWCDLIKGGYKTLEIRKNRPRMATPFKCYIYQTGEYVSAYDLSPWAGKYKPGRIVGEFICDAIDSFVIPHPSNFGEVGEEVRDILEKACLPMLRAHDYLGHRTGYAWHISALKIYNTPKKLEECGLEYAPMSWRYAEEIA